jgi:hypothetical protein
VISIREAGGPWRSGTRPGERFVTPTEAVFRVLDRSVLEDGEFLLRDPLTGAWTGVAVELIRYDHAGRRTRPGAWPVEAWRREPVGQIVVVVPGRVLILFVFSKPVADGGTVAAAHDAGSRIVDVWLAQHRLRFRPPTGGFAIQAGAYDQPLRLPRARVDDLPSDATIYMAGTARLDGAEALIEKARGIEVAPISLPKPPRERGMVRRLVDAFMGGGGRG